jgi:hypothetical protein
MKPDSCFTHHPAFPFPNVGTVVLSLLTLFVRPSNGCGDAVSAGLNRLASQAVSTNEVVAQEAIATLRTRGPAGFQALLRVHGSAIQRHATGATGLSGPAELAERERLMKALDGVGAQRDCAASGLYWHTDFEKAKAVAKAGAKPILSLRLLGRLDEELSCANSRFFRTALYANAEISARLRDHFVLHWQSVRPVPRITIDFGDGRKLERTITGNSIHYVLDGDGRPIDALPGLYGPKAFLQALTRAEEAAARYVALPSPEREEFLRQHHRQRVEALTAEWNRDLAQVGAPATMTPATNRVAPAAGAPNAAEAARRTMAKTILEAPLLRGVMPHPGRDLKTLEAQTDDETWAKLAALRATEARLDERSMALMRRKTPDALAAGWLTISKVRVEDPLLRAVRQFERSMAEDTVRNEYLFHAKIHQWFAEAQASTREVTSLNQRVYAELFLTPDNDPWLGLKSDGVYSAIEKDGVIQPTPR